MKTHLPIQIRAGDLKPVVAGLGKLISRSASLPALQCVKVEMVKRDTVRLTATDLNLTLAIEVPATLGKGGEPLPAPFLIPLERLRDLVRQTGANEAVHFGPVAKAPALDEFPEAVTFRASPIQLPDSAASGLVHAFACASRDKTRYILQGAFLDTTGKGAKAHCIVGTDGRHLFSSNSLHLPKVKGPVILPDHPLWQWKPLAESRPWTLRLGAGKDGIVPFRIDGPHWSVTGKTIEGNYPNYRQVIPPSDQFKTRITMSDPALEAIHRLIPRLPGKKLANSPVGIHLEKGRLGLLARENNDEPWILHPIDTVESTGPEFSSFVNRDYLQKAAAFGLGEIHLIDAMSPVQFSRGGDLMIVMPIQAVDPERIERPKHTAAVKPSIPNRMTAAPEQSERSTATSRKPKVKPERPVPSDPIDPINEVSMRIAKANEAIASAGKQLQEATGSLKTARCQRREEREELSGFRSLFASIKKIATGSH